MLKIFYLKSVLKLCKELKDINQLKYINMVDKIET